jgi:hypothetical protein
VVVALALAALALLNPMGRYGFLNGAKLRSIDIIEVPVHTASPKKVAPVDLTIQIFTLDDDCADVFARMKPELEGDGWTQVTRSPINGLELAVFQRGPFESVYMSERGGALRPPGLTDGRTVVQMYTLSSLFDRVVDRFHRDEIPSVIRLVR